MTDSTVRFGLLCSMFQAMGRDRAAAKKRMRFRTFLERVYTGSDYFSAVRLILPTLDRERGSYGLKESALAAALVDALAIARDSDDALRLINWRKGGARTGANAGNFALVAFDILQRRQGLASGGLTIRDVNDALDQLSLREGRGEKAAVLSDLIKKTNAVEMKWILMIILKDLKLGVSEKTIFHEFHPDAEDLFNVSCDLKLVCEKLKDRGQRHKRQDIEVGRAVRPQLAMRISDAITAWKKFHGKQVVAECKFDGDRIQIHKNGKVIHFFSRNFLDHTEYLHGMSDVILNNVLVDRCILDGEMLVWDTSSNHFAEFGSNQEIAKAAMQGLQGDRQLCYVAFDILYAGDTSVIHQNLTERQELLHKFVKPVTGRLEILVPNNGLNENLQAGEPCWSIIANCAQDVEKFFKETIEKRDEGIVLKDLGSKWEPGDRSGKWLKLKPDYIHAGTDLDVLIIGGYFGSGRHGGEVAQFLVGLAERSDSNSFPKRFLSFCRVGSGLSDEDLDVLITRLKPYFRKNEYPKRIPLFYEVTNNSKERPDVWVESPDKSVILSITSDIRTIKSEVFVAPYSLRFPRIQHVRYDKPWHESLDVESFRDLVLSSNGNTQRGIDQGALQNVDAKPKRLARKGEKRNISVITAHSIQADLSSVKEKTLIFANMMFYFVNVPLSYSVDYFHKVVVENGGSFSMNLNDTVTHCIAAEKKGIKYQAAMRYGDIIHCSWVLDCCNMKKLVKIQSKYFLFFADFFKKKNQEEIDAFSDYYYLDIDIEDIKQIFCNMVGSENSKMIEHYRKKYFPVKRMGLFRNCFIYLHEMPARKTDFKVISELTMRRMKLEITMHGGKVCNDLQLATHLLIYAVLGSHEFDEIYRSFPSTQHPLLHRKELHVLGHNWLEESLDKNVKLPEKIYNLKPDSLEEFMVEDKGNLTFPAIACKIKEQNSAASGKRKRGRRTAPKPVLRPKPRTRSKIVKRSVMLGSDGSESSESLDTAPSIDAPTQSNEEKTASNVGESTKQIQDEWKKKELEGENYVETERKQVIPDSHIIDYVPTHFMEVDNKAGDKLEVMTDPIQAMLLDMIPTLSQNQKRHVDADAPTSIREGKRPLQKPESDPKPVKKKVSYKDVANELLKDW